MPKLDFFIDASQSRAALLRLPLHQLIQGCISMLSIYFVNYWRLLIGPAIDVDLSTLP